MGAGFQWCRAGARLATLEAFAAAFESCGFRRQALYPCYGLAEATLMVSGGALLAGPTVTSFDTAALAAGQVRLASPGVRDAANITRLVGNGRAIGRQEVAIIDPASATACEPSRAGEIWVKGPSVGKGYWNRQQETGQTFGAARADTGDGPFLRTGDLGFVQDGELFVTGRLKDLIIVDGLNHYPQDIELTVDQSHAALRQGCSAAFSVDTGDREQLVVAVEVAPERARGHEPAEIVQAIRQAISDQHELRAHDVVLLQPGSIPKTSSGKIQRHLCRRGYLADTLERWKPE